MKKIILPFLLLALATCLIDLHGKRMHDATIAILKQLNTLFDKKKLNVIENKIVEKISQDFGQTVGQYLLNLDQLTVSLKKEMTTMEFSKKYNKALLVELEQKLRPIINIFSKKITQVMNRTTAANHPFETLHIFINEIKKTPVVSKVMSRPAVRFNFQSDRDASWRTLNNTILALQYMNSTLKNILKTLEKKITTGNKKKERKKVLKELKKSFNNMKKRVNQVLSETEKLIQPLLKLRKTDLSRFKTWGKAKIRLHGEEEYQEGPEYFVP